MNNAVSRRTLLATVSLVWAGSTIVALAAPTSFKVPLTGAQQVPGVQTSGKGEADMTYDPATHELTWSVTYSGLSSAVTMAHFHGPAAEGKNGPPVIWLTKKEAAWSSPIKGQATLTADQATQLMSGQWYINVHTQDHPSGEVRGQVMPPKG
jgi:hypothetical protein